MMTSNAEVERRAVTKSEGTLFQSFLIPRPVNEADARRSNRLLEVRIPRRSL
jgi:hypothetical protein